ncbi:MAG: hypothetical protein N2253_09130, partial [Bacteroidia bacterium]|nr:hypothetical protein [Bacteroidia bacterium]
MMDWKQLKAVPESGCILYLPVKYPSERKKELVALLDHSHIKALRGQEVPIWKRITQAKAEGTRALMVPYVAQRLFPEKEAEDVCLYWELYSGLFDDFCHAEWYVVFSEGKKLNFYFREVHLTLFPSGIGFLEIHIGLKEATLADWVDALSVLRGPYEKAFISLRQDSLRRESVFYLLQLQDRLSSLADIFNHLLPVKPNSNEEGTLYIPNHFVPYAYIITQDAPAQGEE